MKIGRTHHIALYTANFDRMRSFYTTVLGFPVVGEFPGHNILFVDCGSTAIEIVESAARADAGDVGGWTHLALAVDDVDAAYAELSSAGVAFHAAPGDFPPERPQCRIAFFRDPDGNELELYQSFGDRYPR